MSALRLQYHVAPDEFAGLVGECVSGLTTYVAVETFGAEFLVTVLPDGAAGLVDFDRSKMNRVRISLSPIEGPFDSTVKFGEANPGSLVMDPPEVIPDPFGSPQQGLRESMFWARSDDAAEMRNWRAVRRRLEKSLHRGADVVSAQGLGRAPVKSHRFTDGAYALYREGLLMLAIGGSTRYELWPPSEAGP